jgi:hypothetical protein
MHNQTVTPFERGYVIMASTKPESVNVGENVSYSIDGDTLTVVIDMSHRATNAPLEGKKTIRVASTLGNKELPTGVYLGINAYVYPPK